MKRSCSLINSHFLYTLCAVILGSKDYKAELDLVFVLRGEKCPFSELNLTKGS